MTAVAPAYLLNAPTVKKSAFRFPALALAEFAFSADQQKKVSQRSGSERNGVHLARMLKSGATVLLLDEFTTNLDLDADRCGQHAPCRAPSRRSSPPSSCTRAI